MARIPFYTSVMLIVNCQYRIAGIQSLLGQFTCVMQVLSKIEKKVKTFGTLAMLYRRDCQTTLRCCNRKDVVVNGQRKALLKAGRCQGEEWK